ncbi:MAG: TetR/AcrR family transcriptional regulator [Atopobiaceae bacterium]|nr:TetR/AcrR family transcriptional regulator [Atopobiaceae bacterium]
MVVKRGSDQTVGTMMGDIAQGGQRPELGMPAANADVSADAAELLEIAKEKVVGRKVSKTRKSAETRERILAAASELIDERGAVDFQMAEVARRCKMSKGSLYYYFADREEIVQEIFSEAIDRFVSSLEGAVAGARSSSEALHDLCVAFSDCVREGGPLTLAIAVELIQGRSSMLDTIEDRFYRIGHIIEVQLERAKQEGVVRKDLDCSVAASCVCGAFFFSLVEAMAHDRDNLDADDLTDKLVSIVMNGVGVAPVADSSSSSGRASLPQ